MTNPIRKRVRTPGGVLFAWPPRRIWLAVCPVCGEEVRDRQLNTPSRKTVKDALHWHQRKKHPVPR